MKTIAPRRSNLTLLRYGETKMKNPSRPLFLIVIAGLSLNAHALCMNQDGSLDDPSFSPSTIALDVLPPCKKPGDAKAADKSAATVAADTSYVSSKSNSNTRAQKSSKDTNQAPYAGTLYRNGGYFGLANSDQKLER
jgi:hypothetical protein